MKFIVSSDEFTNVLTKLSSVVPARSTHPILENILFNLKGNELKLLSSDLEVFVKNTIMVEGIEDGKVTIPAKRLLEICSSYSSADITIEVNDKNRVLLKTKNGRFTLSGEPTEDFPLPSFKGSDDKVYMDGETLRRFISKVYHAVTKDEIRRNMSGVLLETRDGVTRMVATDGFRLGKITKKAGDDDKTFKVLIPAKTCELISRLNYSDDATLEFGEKDIRVSFGNFVITSKLIDENFPNYENVIPKNNDKTLVVSKGSLLNALKRALYLADITTRKVKFEIKKNTLMVKADSPDIGAEGEETIDCTFESPEDIDYNANPFVISFNGRYLQETVSQIETDEVRFTLNTDRSAVIALPTAQEENEDFMELIMPVRS